MQPIQTSKAFGSAIKQVRKERGLSQAELAARANVGRPWLSELETGKRTVELGRTLSVLSVLGMAVSFVPAPTSESGAVDLDRIIAGGG